MKWNIHVSNKLYTSGYADCFSQDFTFANMESIKVRNHAKRCSLGKQSSLLAPCRKGRFARLHTVCHIGMRKQVTWHMCGKRLFAVPYFFREIVEM